MTQRPTPMKTFCEVCHSPVLLHAGTTSFYAPDTSEVDELKAQSEWRHEAASLYAEKLGEARSDLERVQKERDLLICEKRGLEAAVATVVESRDKLDDDLASAHVRIEKLESELKQLKTSQKFSSQDMIKTFGENEKLRVRVGKLRDTLDMYAREQYEDGHMARKTLAADERDL